MSPPLVLHHLELTLDSATWHDIASSQFMRESFAAIDTINPGADGAPGGLRLIGKYNYLVLYPPETGAAVNSGAIVFSTTDEPTIASMAALPGMVRQPAQPAEQSATETPIARYVDRQATRVELASPTHAVWPIRVAVMRYSDLHASRVSLIDSLAPSRHDNARFLAARFDRHRLFEYISGATIAMPVDEIDKVVAALRTSGVAIVATDERATIDLDGFVLRLVPPWSGVGLQQLVFTLTRDAPANPSYRFGPASQLRFGPGPIATWDLGPHE